MIFNEEALEKMIRKAVEEALNGYRNESITYLRVEDVCEKLNISRAHFDRLVREEGFPIVRIGRSIRIKSSSLDKWVDKREEVSK